MVFFHASTNQFMLHFELIISTTERVKLKILRNVIYCQNTQNIKLWFSKSEPENRFFLCLPKVNLKKVFFFFVCTNYGSGGDWGGGVATKPLQLVLDSGGL